MVESNPVRLETLINLLALDQKQMLLVVFDMFGFEIANHFVDAATVFGIPFCARFIPMAAQIQYANSEGMPNEMQDCVKRCDALVCALSDHEDCTRFRAALLKASREYRNKTLHLPGLELGLFSEALTGLDLTEIRENATRLENILNGATTVEIYTKGSNLNREADLHKLSIHIQDRRAHCDTGIATPGEIAQLPAGEVYVAPREYTAEGDLFINGSTPERVFRKDDIVALHFTKGMVDIGKSLFADTTESRGFRQELLEYQTQDQNNLALGELGIGINGSISHFTGKPIRDEKAGGSAHIALGSNVAFDGVIDCDCHVDLIFIPERVVVDGVDLPCRWGLSNFGRFWKEDVNGSETP